ncbi:MAG TPA: hypothetical protein VFU31_29750 [Candidatus Binatia bacterium]|nr:hypothetical protein [Candidatus Binatia bacterium]
MTSISIEFQSIPMRAGERGFEYGHGDKTVCEISLTAVVEASSRERWAVDEILLWEIGSVRSRVIYYGLDRDSQLFGDLKYWLESDANAVDKINDYVALAILPSGRIVGGDAARAGDAEARV